MKTEELNKYKRIFIGVSGGRDSMCLLDYIYNSKVDKEKIIVINFNYNDEYSNKAEELIRNFCEAKKLKIKVYNKPIAEGNENSWRKERYLFFSEEIKEEDCLLLGHSFTDQESGLLIGFLKNSQRAFTPPVTKMGVYTLYRPLHNVNRNEITKYCLKHNVKFLDDPTNPISQRGKAEECLDELREVIHQLTPSFRKRYNEYLKGLKLPFISIDLSNKYQEL